MSEEWKKYELRELSSDGVERAGPFITYARSPGAAVEYFCVTHGLLAYDTMELRETDEEPEESIEDILAWAPCMGEDPAELDQHHVWSRWEREEDDAT